jgi:hypothetical protein
MDCPKNGMCDSCGKELSTTGNPTGPSTDSCPDEECQKRVAALMQILCGDRPCPSNDDVIRAAENDSESIIDKVDNFAETHPEMMELIGTFPIVTNSPVTKMGDKDGPEIPCSTLLLITLTFVTECLRRQSIKHGLGFHKGKPVFFVRLKQREHFTSVEHCSPWK